MDKLVTRHSSFAAQPRPSFGGPAAAVIRGAAASVIALAVLGTASARSVSVAAIKDGAVTAAFGDADGAAYTLAWGYGPADGGADTNAWAHFETLGEVAAANTSRSVPLPAGWGDTFTHLRFFLLEPEIPAGATRVEYIEATGTQWIDTGVNLYSNDTVVAEYEYPNPIVGKNNYLFGVYKQGMTAGYFYSNGNSYPLRFQKANGTSGATTTEAGINATPGARQTVTMKIGAGTTTIVSASGDTLYSGVLGGTIRQDATAPLALFTANISGAPSSSYTSAAKIYSFRIYDKDGALRLDFIPCTDGNGDPAMYDRVSGNYFHNGGSGSLATGAAMATPLFVAASSVSISAADYSEPDAYLDYVEATGTQMVATECLVGSESRIVAEYEYPDPVARRSNYLFGVYKQGVTAGFYYSNADGVPLAFQRGSGSGNTTTSTGIAAAPGERQTVVMDLGSGVSSIYGADGRKVWSGTLGGSVTAEATQPLSLFTINISGSPSASYRSEAKIYSFRTYDGDTLAHHLVPCLKNGVAGLHDKATGKTLFATGGNLVAGPVLPRPLELVEWVQSDGANGDRQLFIDTGVPARSGVGMFADMEWATKPAGYGTNNIFCGATSSAGKRIWLYDAVADSGNAGATHRMGYNGWRLQLESNNVARAGIRYRIESSFSPGTQYLYVGSSDGTAAERGYTDATDVSTEQTLYVFANNNAGTAEPVSAAARLYSLVLTNDLGVVRDFLPCVADNGEAGLYDRFSERVFFPQAAAENAEAAFHFASEVGASTNSVAAAGAPLARLAYVQSDGTNDYVNLGVVGRDGTKMVADMEWVTVDTSAHTFLGAAASSSSLFTTYRINDNQQRMGYANGSRTINSGTTTPVSGTRYRVTTTLDDGAQSLLVEKKVDGVWTTSGSRTATDAGPMDTGLPLTLFARNLNGSPDEFSAARVYSLKLWQKNGGGDYVLVRDLVPAKAPDGQPALYDRASQTWFRNAGRYALNGGTESPWRDGFVFGIW